MAAEDDFIELGEKLDRLARYYERRTAGTVGDGNVGRTPTGEFASPDGFYPKSRINAGIKRAMVGRGGKDGIVGMAQARAENHVPEEAAQTIGHRSVTWNKHYLYATADLVAHHEFGTSTKADDKSRATINAPDEGGYIIPIPKYDDIRFGPEDFPQRLDDVGPDIQIVVHPGVEGKHFMEKTLDENTGRIQREVSKQLEELEFELR